MGSVKQTLMQQQSAVRWGWQKAQDIAGERKADARGMEERGIHHMHGLCHDWVLDWRHSLQVSNKRKTERFQNLNGCPLNLTVT